MTEEQQLLARTNPDIGAEEALDAIQEYLARFGDRPAAFDVFLTSMALRMVAVAAILAQDDFESLERQNVTNVVNNLPQDLPLRLANGVPSTLRLVDPKHRQLALSRLESMRVIFVAGLTRLFDEVSREAESLFSDGKSKAQLKRITIQQAYRKADTFYQAYKEQDYEAAERGFEYLKTVNPVDPYFRQMLSASQVETGHHLQALREILYASHLQPGRGDLSSNLSRELAGMSMFPAILDVTEYHRLFGDGKSVAEMKLWARFARVCIAIFAGSFFPLDAFSSTSPDAFDELCYPGRPWLTAPEGSC